MPVISREDVGVDGKTFKRIIKVDSKGVFSTELPLAVAERLQINPKITGKSKDLLLGEWKRRLDEYEKVQTTTKKVILYQAKYTCHIVDPADPEHIVPYYR